MLDVSKRFTMRKTNFVTLSLLALAACAGDAAAPPQTAASQPSDQSATDTGPPDQGATDTGPPRTECGPGQEKVASESQCLQDDAVCYKTSDGSWCTGAAAPECPSGYKKVSSSSDCLQDTKCFQVSESAWCTGPT